ncbi:MAG: protein kinase [Phycisphaerales bacterium]
MSTPDRIGSFQIEAEIGRGGHGVVYRARDQRLDRLVAIKAIPDNVSSDPSRMTRFRDEARIIAQLNHPHIAQIHQLLEEDGKTYLVLEYVRGQALHHVAAQLAGRLDRILPLVLQIADALDSAHAHGIIHRDLKPDNILVTESGDAKVLDFGIACTAPKATDASTPTLVGGVGADAPVEAAMTGTPGYMSPEQCRAEAVDARADIFSFGCVLYECLTGRRAIDGHTNADRIAATLVGQPDYSHLPAELPDGVAALVRSCLARRADDRLESIHDARVVLQGAVAPPRSLKTSTDQEDVAAKEPTRRTNLPRSFDRFIGRAAEVVQITQALHDRVLTTLVGAGGCGKTRLAIEVARRVQHRFEGGVWLVDLSARDAERVVDAIAAAMGLSDEPGRSQLDAVADHISTNPVLLVLDNCEHVREGARDVAMALVDRCSELRILATGREPLAAPGELAWRVPSLGVPGRATRRGRMEVDSVHTPATPATTPPAATPADGWAVDDLLACESVALFIERAREVRAGFALNGSNAPAVASICRRLDGIPLAIELAAARIGMLSAEQIERHLDDRFRLLRSSDVRKARHQTLRAAIDWSFHLLDDLSRRVLQRLAVFTEGCSLEGACWVLGPDADLFETLDMLTVLSDKSLLVSEHIGASARYRLMESVREYALERLEAEGELDEVQSRRLRFYDELALGARDGLTGTDQGAWLERLDVCAEDLLDAIDTAADSAAELAQRVCAGVWRYWWVRGRIRVGLMACDRACRASLEPTTARADARYAAGAMAWTIGEHESAWAQQSEALAIYEQLGDARGKAASLNSLGLIAMDRGDLAEAERLFGASLAMKRKRGDRRGEAMSLNNLGIVARLANRLVEAKTNYARSAEILRELGDHRAMARSLMNVAELAQRTGDLSEAHRGFEQARSSFVETGDRQGTAIASANLGAVLGAEGRPTEAAPLLAEAITIFQELGDRGGFINAIEAVADLALSVRVYDAAAHLVGATRVLREDWGLPRDAGQREVTERLNEAPGVLDGDARKAWAQAEARGRAMDDLAIAAFALQWLAGWTAP